MPNSPTGSVIMLLWFCASAQAAEPIREAMAKRDLSRYVSLMRSPAVQCVDYRLGRPAVLPAKIDIRSDIEPVIMRGRKASWKIVFFKARLLVSNKVVITWLPQKFLPEV